MDNNGNSRKGELILLLKLLATVLAAAGAAAVFRRGSGVLAMWPAAVAICLAAAFIGLNIWIKCAVFGITVFAFNTVESEMKIALTFTALCVVAVAVLSYGAKIFRKKKAAGVAVLVGGFIVCSALNVYFVGDPVKAYSAQKRIKEYISGHYPDDGVLSVFSQGSGAKADDLKVDFSKIYYDRDSGAYAVSAVCRFFPTREKTISVPASGGVVSDGFAAMLEELIAESYRERFAELLRGEFPGSLFEITSSGINGFPDKDLLSGGSEPVLDCVSYDIRVGGTQTAREFDSAVKRVVDVFTRADMSYHEITFSAGIGAWYRRTCVVNGSVGPKGREFKPVSKLSLVGSGRNINLFLDAIADMN